MNRILAERLRWNLGNFRACGQTLAQPCPDLRFRLQLDPHTTKKALPSLLSREQIIDCYALRDGFKARLTDLAMGSSVEGYRVRNDYLQVGKVPVALDRGGTLGEAAKKLWEESVWMAPLIDEALLQVGSPGYSLKVLEDDGEAKEGKALPCFQTEFG